MELRFTRGEYWLLENVVEHEFEVGALIWSDLELFLNKTGHGLTRKSMMNIPSPRNIEFQRMSDEKSLNAFCSFEPTIEIIEAPLVLKTNAKTALKNQVGRAATTDKISGTGLQGSETVSTSAAPVHPDDTEP